MTNSELAHWLRNEIMAEEESKTRLIANGLPAAVIAAQGRIDAYKLVLQQIEG